MLHFIQLWGAIFVGLLAGVSIVTGAHLALKPSTNIGQSKNVTRIFAFGTGAFFTAVCLDFLPDAWSANGTRTPFWLFIGALLLWAATHASDGLFDHEQNQQLAAPESTRSTWNTTLKFTPVSAVVLAVALSFHTFLEGTAVALSFHDLNWKTLGFALAMILHKLPEGVLWGIALTAVFPRDGAKIRRTLIIPAVCTLAGVFLGIFLANQASSSAISVSTGLVAGAMFYIAFAELLPALRETNHPRQARNWFVIGLVIMFCLNSLSNVFGG